MSARRPSKKQLGYLKGLGYKGEPPETMGEASAAIEEMLDSGSSAKAERAIERARREEERYEKRERKRRFAMIRQQIRSMVRENKMYGGEGLYAGFQFTAMDEDDVDEDELPYLDAFVPIQVAEKHPEILEMETLDVEEILCDDMLPNGTKMIVSPGRYTLLGAWFKTVYDMPDVDCRKAKEQPAVVRCLAVLIFIAGIGLLGFLCVSCIGAVIR